jgi:hypothetical protein
MSDPKTGFFIIDCGHAEFRNPARVGGRKLESLPFPGAIYITATGENDSGSSYQGWHGIKFMLGNLLTARPLTIRIRSEFGLYDLGRTPLCIP